MLPEDAIREEIARNLGVSSRSDFALLREIGGDCAGAISIGDSKNASSGKYEELIEDKRLIESLKPLTGKPLLAGKKDVRLSIAGSQIKLPVIYSTNFSEIILWKIEKNLQFERKWQCSPNPFIWRIFGFWRLF